MRSTKQDFSRLFEGKPGLYLVLNPDLTIAAVSEQYLRATFIWNEELTGRHLFEVFPQNPHQPGQDGVRNLEASLKRVLRMGAAHRMPLQRYDVPDRMLRDGRWIEKYWSPVNHPIFAPGTRQITHLIHQVVDQTPAMHFERWFDEQELVNQEQQKTLRQLFKDTRARQRELRTARERLEKFLESGEDPGMMLDELLPRFGRRGQGRYSAPGETALLSGIYYAFHQVGCHFLRRSIHIRSGQLFPLCPNCGEGVRYCVIDGQS